MLQTRARASRQRRRAGDGVEDEVVAVEMIENTTSPGYRAQTAFVIGVPGEQHAGDADEQRVGGVQARHRGVRVGNVARPCRGSRPSVLSVSTKPSCGEHPRRRRRDT